jgi:hypothetical protein
VLSFFDRQPFSGLPDRINPVLGLEKEALVITVYIKLRF